MITNEITIETGYDVKKVSYDLNTETIVKIYDCLGSIIENNYLSSVTTECTVNEINLNQLNSNGNVLPVKNRFEFNHCEIKILRSGAAVFIGHNKYSNDILSFTLEY